MIPFCRGGLQAGRAGAIHHGHLEVGQRALKCRQPSPAVPTRPPGRGLPLVSLGGPRTPLLPVPAVPSSASSSPLPRLLSLLGGVLPFKKLFPEVGLGWQGSGARVQGGKGHTGEACCAPEGPEPRVDHASAHVQFCPENGPTGVSGQPLSGLCCLPCALQALLRVSVPDSGSASPSARPSPWGSPGSSLFSVALS